MSRWNGEKVKAVFGGRGFYIALAFCLVAAGVIGYYTLLRPQQPTTPEPSDTPVLQPEWTVPSQPEPDDADEPAAPTMEPAQPEDLLPQVVSPLDGTTVTVFSTTELLYDETMADWRTHSGIDIQAAEGDSVKTAASGKVVKVEDDELMGTTVVIEHAGGYSTQYSCLQKDPPVTVGQEVAAGDVIGQVALFCTAAVLVAAEPLPSIEELLPQPTKAADTTVQAANTKNTFFITFLPFIMMNHIISHIGENTPNLCFYFTYLVFFHISMVRNSAYIDWFQF